MPDESIDCVITSPPYWSLRDYGTHPVNWGDWKGEFGLEPTFDLYIKHLCDIFDEVKRVLKKTGTCWVNLGDTYGTHTGKRSGQFGISIDSDINKVFTTNRPNLGLEKSLCQIPSRFAIEMCDPNWVLREDLTQEERQFVIGELIKRRLL
jgi:DNA modification methylase